MDDFNQNKATTSQVRYFFKLCSELDVDSESARERAKQLFKLDSFSHVSKGQMSYLIEKMVRRLNAEKVVKKYGDFLT